MSACAQGVSILPFLQTLSTVEGSDPRPLQTLCLSLNASLCLSSPADLLGASEAASQAICWALQARGPRGFLCCFSFGSERTRHRITDSPRCRGECEGGESPGWRPLKSPGIDRIAPARDSSLGSRSVPAAVHRGRASSARPGFLASWAGRERCTCHVGFLDPTRGKCHLQ